MEAIAIIANKLMENRIEETNSTNSASHRRFVCSSIPEVLDIMMSYKKRVAAATPILIFLVQRNYFKPAI
jgi:hypothetical protein